MNYLFFQLLAIFSIMTACNHDKNATVNETFSKGQLKITVGSSVFTARLFDNATAKAFKEILPLTLHLRELNSNEKYGELPRNLPVNDHKPNAIKNGDLMLFGSRTLVLFYKDFTTSYPYTPLGKIEDTTGLASALGSGDVTLTFEIK